MKRQRGFVLFQDLSLYHTRDMTEAQTTKEQNNTNNNDEKLWKTNIPKIVKENDLSFFFKFINLLIYYADMVLRAMLVPGGLLCHPSPSWYLCSASENLLVLTPHSWASKLSPCIELYLSSPLPQCLFPFHQGWSTLIKV